MYERFYHLRERPFALSPDPDYLYPSRVHREALDYLRFGIEGHAGFVLITGEIGSGKTMLLQVLLRNLDGQTTVVRLANTLLEPKELLEAMLIDLGIANVPATKPAMLRELARVLIEQRGLGRRVLAVIDEAQNLSIEALEEIRMLSNLETEKSKLVQIILVGQPDLREKLDSLRLKQLRQRVTVRYHMTPLDAAETANYINHRLSRAALEAPLQFAREVTDVIHARSGGIPRLINVICDSALLFGYGEERRVIDLPLLTAVFEELETSGVLRPAEGGPIQAVPVLEPSPAAESLDAGPETRALPLTRQLPRCLPPHHRATQSVARGTNYGERKARLTEQRRFRKDAETTGERPPTNGRLPAASYCPAVAPVLFGHAIGPLALHPFESSSAPGRWTRVKQFFVGPRWRVLPSILGADRKF